jgi:hypothetical protein
VNGHRDHVQAGQAYRATMAAAGRDARLTWAQRFVCHAIGGQLASYSRLEDGITVEWLVRVTGLSERTVREAIRVLVAAGYLGRHHVHGTQLGATFRFLHLRGVAGDDTDHLRGAAGDVTSHLRGAAGITCEESPYHLRPVAPSVEVSVKTAAAAARYIDETKQPGEGDTPALADALELWTAATGEPVTGRALERVAEAWRENLDGTLAVLRAAIHRPGIASRVGLLVRMLADGDHRRTLPPLVLEALPPASRNGPPPADHRAGWVVSRGSYLRGCRCDACREAANAYQRDRRRRLRAEAEAAGEEDV